MSGKCHYSIHSVPLVSATDTICLSLFLSIRMNALEKDERRVYHVALALACIIL